MTKVKAVPVEGQKVYRYIQVNYAAPLDEFENPIGKGRTAVELREFDIISMTPKGVWIDGDERKKFINMEARRKFACLTKEAALESFIARKERHILILLNQAEAAKKALYLAKKQAGLIDNSKERGILPEYI